MYDAYLICTTPRSGSTMLCDLLRQTGVAGWPESFFRPQSVPDFCTAFGLQRQDGNGYTKAYIEAALTAARHEGAVLGLRFMWDAMPIFEARLKSCYGLRADGAGLHSKVLGRTGYIFLDRKDKVAQAISRARAEQSGLWHRNADGSVREQTGIGAKASYDPRMIQMFLDEQLHDIAQWRGWFSENGLTPYHISYEELASSPRKTLAALLDTLGLDRSRTSGLAPGTAKLADDISREWADRFRQDQ